jgi:hypothetical protein
MSANLSIVTSGLFPDSSNGLTSLLTGGLLSLSTKQPNQNELSPIVLNAQANAIVSNAQTQLGTLGNPNAGLLQASIGVPIGNINVSYNLNDLVSNPTSATGSQIYNPNGAVYGSQESDSNITTYTGSDIKIIVDLVNATTTSNTNPGTKQLVEATTFSISIHREKSAVRAAGYINPKGFARGRRTIAGTMVLTQFTVDILYSFLMSQQINAHDISVDTNYVKVDQLPPFNMTLLFADELGNASWRRVLGVDFVTDGVVYSSNDLLSEQTISYMASDFTPLMLLKDNSLFNPLVQSTYYEPFNTVGSLLKGSNNPAIPSTNIYT